MRSALSRSGARRVLALISVTVVGVLLAAPSGPIGAGSSEHETPPEETTTSTTEDDGGIFPLPGEDITSTSEVDETTTTTEEDVSTTTDGPAVTEPPSTSDEPPAGDVPPTTSVPTPTFGGPVVPGPATSTTEPPDDGGGNGLSLGTVVFLMVSAMLLAAALLAWITWRIWHRTRPRLPEGAVAARPWHQRMAEYLRI